MSTPSPSSSRSSSLSSVDTSPRTPPNLHQNTIDPDATWVVQKFGGTSVGKFAVKIAKDIVSSYIDTNKIAIVCSARSGSTKALGTTNLLLRASAEALQRRSSKPSSGTATPSSRLFSSQSRSASPPPYAQSSHKARSGSSGAQTPAGSQSPALASSSLSFSCFTPINGPPVLDIPDFGATVGLIKQEHVNAARASVQNEGILRELEEEIDRDCEWLKGFLFAAQVIDEISSRSKDSIIGLGERMACKLMTAILRDQGIDAEYVSLEDIVPPSDDEVGDKTLDQEFYDSLAIAMGERIKACAPRVPVVTGFFGPVPGSLLRQIGRGYTDLCSALLSVGLQAAELQIWKEVDGIFTADPRKVPTARLISEISPDEAAELTYYGSEVVHPFTMEQVIRRRIPIRIKNVENPSGGGTVIRPDPEHGEENGEHSVGALRLADFNMDSDVHDRKRLPTAVTIKEHIVVINVNSNRKSVSHGFLAGIFGTLDKFGVVVDLISTSEVHVSMAIEDGLAKRIMERLVEELRKNGTVSLHKDMAILSLVGNQMRNMVGIAGRMFTTLAQGNVNIEMISQGASEINISCVIDGRDAVKALNLIHQSCLQIRPEGARGRVGPWLF